MTFEEWLDQDIDPAPPPVKRGEWYTPSEIALARAAFEAGAAAEREIIAAKAQSLMKPFNTEFNGALDLVLGAIRARGATP